MKNIRTYTLFFILFLNSISPLYAQDFWETLPFPDSLIITCIAVNAQGDIFVGTNTMDIADGIFRSQDEGQTWQLVLAMEAFGVGSIAINDQGEIFIAAYLTSHPLWKSSDNGQNWEALSLPNFGDNVKIVSQGNDTLFVSQWANNGAVLLRSTNGGIDWESVFTTENHPGEYISDIAISGNGDVYISLMCFFPNMGGVYKSTDNGTNWEYVALVNHQVKDIEINALGDVFIGVYCDFDIGGGGIYALYHDSTEIHECLFGPLINGLTINSANDIYAGCGMPSGIIRSLDNGYSFDFINNGLPIGPIGKLEKDSQDYIYALSDAPSNRIFRTIEPTVTSISVYFNQVSYKQLKIIPNPVNDMLHGLLPLSEVCNGKHLLTLTEPAGKTLLHKSIDVKENWFQINVSSLKPGVYFITVNDEKFNYYGKFIKL